MKFVDFTGHRLHSFAMHRPRKAFLIKTAQYNYAVEVVLFSLLKIFASVRLRKLIFHLHPSCYNH